MPQSGAIDGIAHAARVSEVRLRHAPRKVIVEYDLRLVVEAIVHGVEHALRDQCQLIRLVIRKIDVMRDARRHAGIALEETRHPILVAGEYHDQIVAMVLHHLQQDLDRLLSVVALVLRPIEVIRFVDEQHAAHRLLQDFLRLRRGVTDVLTDQIIARDGDQVAFADVPQAMQDRGHPHRDGRLAGAWVAGEAHVQARPSRGKPALASQPMPAMVSA